MTAPFCHQQSAQRPAFGSGQRHWFRITGLPGWRRAQLGLPGLGSGRCFPDPSWRNRLAASGRQLQRWLRQHLRIGGGTAQNPGRGTRSHSVSP